MSEMDYKDMLVCKLCGSADDTIDFYEGDEWVVLCVHCRAKYLGKKIDTAGWEPEE